MGIAAYNRGSQAISNSISRDFPVRPAAFETMDRINALPKFENACPVRNLLKATSKPFGGMAIIEKDQFRDVWWVMCPDKMYDGFSFWYKSLSDAVRSWDVYLTGYDEQLNRWTAEVFE